MFTTVRSTNALCDLWVFLVPGVCFKWMYYYEFCFKPTQGVTHFTSDTCLDILIYVSMKSYDAVTISNKGQETIAEYRLVNILAKHSCHDNNYHYWFSNTIILIFIIVSMKWCIWGHRHTAFSIIFILLCFIHYFTLYSTLLYSPVSGDYSIWLLKEY